MRRIKTIEENFCDETQTVLYNLSAAAQKKEDFTTIDNLRRKILLLQSTIGAENIIGSAAPYFCSSAEQILSGDEEYFRSAVKKILPAGENQTENSSYVSAIDRVWSSLGDEEKKELHLRGIQLLQYCLEYCSED